MPEANKCRKTIKAPLNVLSACSTVLPHLYNTDVRVNDFVKNKAPFREERQVIREFLIEKGADFDYSICYNYEARTFNFTLGKEVN